MVQCLQHWMSAFNCLLVSSHHDNDDNDHDEDEDDDDDDVDNDAMGV